MKKTNIHPYSYRIFNKGVALFVCLLPVLSFAQGNLTPPGAPVPTMKTLQQVEPRTQISSVPYIITNSGSYYLTSELTGLLIGQGGITIQANNVVVDLNGFALIGSPLTGSGILVSGNRTNLCVRNGTIRDWSDGVNSPGAHHSLFENLRIFKNGTRGMDLGNGNLVEHCVIYSNGALPLKTGVGSTIKECSVQGNAGPGITVSNRCTIVQCTALANAGEGIIAGNGSVIRGCISATNTANGINVGEGCTVADCVAESNVGYGIYANQAARITDCSAVRNVGKGIYVFNSSIVSGCMAFSNTDEGFVIGGSGSNITGCTARSNLRGISLGAYNTVSQCTAIFNTYYGISSNSNGNTVRDCIASGNGDYGIQVAIDSLVIGNNCNAQSLGTGIYALSSGNRIEGNNITGNNFGIDVNVAGNVIVKNSARGNTNNYGAIVAGNVMGPIVTSATVTTNTNPHANYQF